MATFDITLGPTGNSGANRIVFDGEDITHRVRSIRVGTGVDEATTVIVEYIAVDVDIDGEGIVTEGTDA